MMAGVNMGSEKKENMVRLQVRNLCKVFGEGDSEVTALKDVNLEIQESEFVMIVGPSGCGKTTLINIIGGLEHQTSGEVRAENERDLHSVESGCGPQIHSSGRPGGV